MKNISRILFAALVASVVMSSCTTVKSYQKMYLNDSDMKLAGRKVAKVETYFQFYREGAAGANGGKTGGGCGCN
ncbi:MAG TPA: arginine decarboxylase [Microscillaceae bacterium]|nr:arginine decarboxylase [Microscillaceae bacterium]